MTQTIAQRKHLARAKDGKFVSRRQNVRQIEPPVSQPYSRPAVGNGEPAKDTDMRERFDAYFAESEAGKLTARELGAALVILFIAAVAVIFMLWAK